MKIEVLIIEGCPHAQKAIDVTTEVASNLVPEEKIEVLKVDSPTFRPKQFFGSPTILINGEDIEVRREKALGGLTCRIYEGGSGVPPSWLIEAAIIRALKPKGILFLCINNSARSQIAEGIAHVLLPPEVEVWSAGSDPTEVNEEAITVLSEIGIDISHQKAKPISEIPGDKCEVVITLCGQEICPVFVGRVKRLHWPFEDPARIENQEERIASFRKVRDELYRRISHMTKIEG